MTAPDLLTAVRRFLLSQPGVSGQVSQRVWGEEIPLSETDNMPRKGVLIRRAGGYLLTGDSYQELGDPRFDIYTYGATPLEAATLYLAVYSALKQMTRNVQGPALLHWAKPAGGPISDRQPDTEWPLVLSIWQVLGSEREVT